MAKENTPVAGGCQAHTATPTWSVAAYPVAGSPAGVTSSDDKLSAKMPSDVFVVGLTPREA